MNLIKRKWLALSCAVVLVMSIPLTALGTSATTAPANAGQQETSDVEQDDQVEQAALMAQVTLSLDEAEAAFQALYPDWTIVSAQLEEEDGILAYAIQATDINGASLEATISAQDGSVIPEQIGENGDQGDQNEGGQNGETENDNAD